MSFEVAFNRVGPKLVFDSLKDDDKKKYGVRYMNGNNFWEGITPCKLVYKDIR